MNIDYISNKIAYYLADGFEKVCDVYHEYADSDFSWQYYNINEDLMYGDHNSWVYFIVSGEDIMKVGETGQPLGIKSSNALLVGVPNKDYEYDYSCLAWCQPVQRSTNRFGRLCGRFYGDNDTDWYIRTSLHTDVLAGKVSLWAKKCDKVEHTYQIAGKTVTVFSTVHKDLEVLYIDAINPPLNKGRK
jgi:hypothetical protein